MQAIPPYSEEMPIKLGLKDKKLLFELDFNARLPYSKLARKTGLSKQGVEYKIRNLMKKGVIKGFYPVINVPKLGYHYCRLMLTLQNVTQETYWELVDALKANDKVFWLFQMQGQYDILIVIWAKTLEEFRQFRDDIEATFGFHIKRKVETVATDVAHFQHRYLLGKAETEEIHIRETEKREEIDALDKKILSLLCKDARMSLVDMSLRLGHSAKVIAYRIRRMESSRLIEGYRPIIDHNKIGYTYYKLLLHLNNISKSELLRLRGYMRRNPAVIYFVDGIGLPADFEIEMMVRSNQELFKFVEDLKFKFPTIIGEYQTVIFMDTLKVRYLPFD